ncbi:MAG: sensor histidine kinase [Cyanobacteriota bacterium]
MVWFQGIHPRLKDIFSADSRENGAALGGVSAEAQWRAALGTVEEWLLTEPTQGLCLAGPAPIFHHPTLTQAVFTPGAWRHFLPLPDAEDLAASPGAWEIPLLPQDPLAQEQFCLIATPRFSLFLLLSETEAGELQFDFTFDPEAIQTAWLSLRSRLLLLPAPQLAPLEELWQTFSPPAPDYRLVTRFCQALLNHLPPPKPKPAPSLDVELLRALTHEIRTPLTSIRTLTRLLLRRSDLSPEAQKRVQAIDQECTEQIDRMDLIFRAAALQGQRPTQTGVTLGDTALDQVLKASIPRWRRQAQRHRVDLQVELPPSLPQVISDSILLDQVLTGLIEKFVRRLSGGGQIRLCVSAAGPRLKVQFHTQSSDQLNPLKALGALLMFQPETGSLCLNWDVTKNLFQSLGGKLTVRRRSPQEEELTIYLPLGKPTETPLS